MLARVKAHQKLFAVLRKAAGFYLCNEGSVQRAEAQPVTTESDRVRPCPIDCNGGALVERVTNCEAGWRRSAPLRLPTRNDFLNGHNGAGLA
jgi:hypothetical protein